MKILISLLLFFSGLSASVQYRFSPDWVFTFRGYRAEGIPISAHFNHFSIESKRRYVGTVRRPAYLWEALTLTYNIESNSIGNCTAVAPLVSMGTFFTAKRELYIYDSLDNTIGYIAGEYFTDNDAKFVVYDSHYSPIAIAIVYDDRDELKVVSATDPEQELARATKSFGSWRRFFESEGDHFYYHWDVLIHDEGGLDPRVFWVLMTFVADYYWKPPKESTFPLIDW